MSDVLKLWASLLLVSGIIGSWIAALVFSASQKRDPFFGGTETVYDWGRISQIGLGGTAMAITVFLVLFLYSRSK